MKAIRRFSLLVLGALSGAGGVGAQTAPHLQTDGATTQLIVDGAPFVALAGELHNSSPSSPAFMKPVWDHVAKQGLNTVIGAASWELVEAAEGKYDFAAVDAQIEEAHARGLHLVLIWFGAYKNAESSYAPSWVRRDPARFPRAQRDPTSKTIAITNFLNGPVLSVFGQETARADARAFAALMKHVRSVDKSGTVIMMQVENETGLLGDSRDRSPVADAAWAQPVPGALMNYLAAHRAQLRPSLLETWGRGGYRAKGTWAEVFGSDAAAEQIFMAWGFGRYLQTVAEAGAAQYALPMYANAWLGPQPGATVPGSYPSGGPVAPVTDVWKAAAPALALLAPDIYIDDFEGTLGAFQRADNPVFIPEAKPIPGNLYIALGRHKVIGFSPFGVEDFGENDEIFKSYRVLAPMTELIATAQREDRIRGFSIAPGGKVTEQIGGYTVTVSQHGSSLGAFGPGTSTADQAKAGGYGLIIAAGPDEFIVVGKAISLAFSAPGATVELDSAQEGTLADGHWVAGRTLNGDERYALFPNEAPRIVRVKVLRR